MSEDIIWEQFKILEGKIVQLVKVCHALEEEKAELAVRLAETEKMVNQREDENKSLMDERVAIREKIDSILLKLDNVSSA